jgi:hypothetical protein
MRALAAAALACALGAPAAAQELTVPAMHAALYRALDTRLDAFQTRLPALSFEPPLLRAAPLASARCAPDAGSDSEARWRAALRELDALRRAGAQAIVLEVCYPLLSPAFRDPRPLLERYANLANEVRLRQMHLLVRHAALPAHGGMAETGRYYRSLKRQRLMAERYEEARSIALALRPDYLTLLSDPAADSAGLALRARDWRAYLTRASADLRRELGDLAPPLGAGLGAWGDTTTLEAVAAVPGLAYLDLRFYPASLGGEDLLERIVLWPRRVRAIDPGKRIVLSEAWLYKGEPAAPFEGADIDALARESFGFWSPLDVKFLRAAAHAARASGIELLGVSRPQYLFAYVDFFDPATYRARPRVLLDLAAQRAAGAIERGELTDTGRAFGAM